jgi:hypothetical protein
MNRRGALGGLMGLLGAGSIGRSAAGEEGVSLAYMPDPAHGEGMGRGLAGQMPLDPARGAKVAEFRRLRRGLERQRDRVRERLELTGGVPPGVLACKSWRPWFQAAVAHRQLQVMLPDQSVLEKALWLSVFGEPLPDPGDD